MARTSKKTQARHCAQPFSVAAQHLGEALANVVTHPRCPQDVIDAISEMDARIFNHCNDLAISLRHNFPYLLTSMLEEEA